MRAALAETGMATLRRFGPTILIGSGNYCDYENPEESVLTIEDIAYGLGFTCRFETQTVDGPRARGLLLGGGPLRDHEPSCLRNSPSTRSCGSGGNRRR